jgi:acyl-CoA synthetase (AMP-forming)/AMP-acid ligase II
MHRTQRVSHLENPSKKNDWLQEKTKPKWRSILSRGQTLIRSHIALDTKHGLNSGTTGKPKAVAIPHHAVIANVIQNAAFVRLNDPTLAPDRARYRKGDVNLSVLPLFRESQNILIIFELC